MNLVKGILLKLVSALLFAIMSALIRGLGDAVPLGQVVFFRSSFAIAPRCRSDSALQRTARVATGVTF